MIVMLCMFLVTPLFGSEKQDSTPNQVQRPSVWSKICICKQSAAREKPSSTRDRSPSQETMDDLEDFNDPKDRINAIREADRTLRNKKCCDRVADSCMWSTCIIGSVGSCFVGSLMLCPALADYLRAADAERARDVARFDEALMPSTNGRLD